MQNSMDLGWEAENISVWGSSLTVSHHGGEEGLQYGVVQKTWKHCWDGLNGFITATSTNSCCLAVWDWILTGSEKVGTLKKPVAIL